MPTPSEAVAERQRRQARERQARRRARLREERGELPTRHCLCCLHPFQPRRADSWLCSRRCVDRVSWHRRQAQRALTGALLRGVRRHVLAEQQQVDLQTVEEAYRRAGRAAELQSPTALAEWWRSDRCQARTDSVAHYRLWFPDLCEVPAAEALVERLEWQRTVAAAWAAVEQGQG